MESSTMVGSRNPENSHLGGKWRWKIIPVYRYLSLVQSNRLLCKSLRSEIFCYILSSIWRQTRALRSLTHSRFLSNTIQNRVSLGLQNIKPGNLSVSASLEQNKNQYAQVPELQSTKDVKGQGYLEIFKLEYIENNLVRMETQMTKFRINQLS